MGSHGLFDAGLLRCLDVDDTKDHDNAGNYSKCLMSVYYVPSTISAISQIRKVKAGRRSDLLKWQMAEMELSLSDSKVLFFSHHKADLVWM